MTMKKEQILYNKFVDKLNELLDKPDITDKELRIILNFLTDNNIGANPEENEHLKGLIKKYEETDLPFDDEELPLESLNDSN